MNPEILIRYQYTNEKVRDVLLLVDEFVLVDNIWKVNGLDVTNHKMICLELRKILSWTEQV